MKIAQRYSHLHGYEFIEAHKPKLWAEIRKIIQGADAEVPHTKARPANQTYSRRSARNALREQFRRHGWCEHETTFYVTPSAKLIQKTLNLPADEQRRAIEDAGEEAIRRADQVSFVKNRVAIEIQFGKSGEVAYDLFVKHPAFYVGDVIDVGIEIVPVGTQRRGQKRAFNAAARPATYENELYNLIREGRGIPLVLIGVAP